ncbi:hypothetical protein MZD04_gp017 [Pseudomonas phage Psa21]|uniref:Uncharacterized protein n=1 Tax=Pseudomonas phage Psa21 TaxID=2530023 RepID=A0A481W5J5_9CAUD|nr:hypothetical protein MZD04_gp017 [Pseudomonas phage Psa21]QBJ02547.1 hypothetical protein PSA21_17 [Pseudomonas phage Psa21]
MKNGDGKVPLICGHMRDMSLVSQYTRMNRKVVCLTGGEEKELEQLAKRLKNNNLSSDKGFDPGNVIIVGAPTQHFFRPMEMRPLNMDVMSSYPDPRIELTISNYPKKPDVSQVSKKVLALLARAQ